MASDQHPLDSFLAAARGALAHLHLPIHIPGSNPTTTKQQQRQPDCLLHLHLVLTNFLHKPLRSFSRCFGNDDKPKRGRSKHSLPPSDTGKKQQQQNQIELLLCISFDALAHNLQVLEGACKQKGEEFGSAALQMDQFQLVRKVIVGKKADFDGFLSNLGFARVGAPPASFVDDSSISAPSAEGQEGPTSVIGDREGVDSGGDSAQQPPQKFAGRLLNIPLSNVERLRSTLSTVSLTELIESVPQLVGRLSTSGDNHPDKKKLFSVQDFFRYAEFEGKRFFEELDRDGDGQVTLEDLEVAMRKRRLPRRYARDLLRRTRSNFFSKSIGWKQFLSLMEQKEATILRAYTTLCLSKSGTLQKNQILESLKGAGLPANEDNAAAMLRYLNADSEGSICKGIKKRLRVPLKRAAGAWVEELPSVLWSLRTTPNRSTQYTPFFMVYGAEAVMPCDIKFDAPRVVAYDESEAEEALEDDLDTLDEARDIALTRTAVYQQDLRNYHGRRLRPRAFIPGDLVLRLKQKKVHKLASPWEGPYIMTEAIGGGAYRLNDSKTGTVCSNPWNMAQLRRFYA